MCSLAAIFCIIIVSYLRNGQIPIKHTPTPCTKPSQKTIQLLYLKSVGRHHITSPPCAPHVKKIAACLLMKQLARS